ncbi:MAG: alpha-ketoglutarate-dependent dioxygenase AlkB [Deltaproteobacteria bacterium]|nr:MAG: alpha-ketoglutarate-dependent dioxygenase AlkB [Deltaproteobacteria bacterium]
MNDALVKKDLTHGAWIAYDAQFLAPDEADAALAALLEELAWEQRANVVFGKEVVQPRLSAWAGAIPYRFSGQTLEPRAPSPTLAALSERVVDAVGHAFNHVVINRYRDGSDWIARHADNERELGYRPLIAALSLGATRRFELYRKKGRRTERKRLTHGSLLVMGGSCQHTWRHALPKDPACTDERLNLTWRTLHGPPGWSRDPSDDPNRRERDDTPGSAEDS